MTAIIITIIISVTVGTMWALCAANKEFEENEEDEEAAESWNRRAYNGKTY